VLSVPLSHLVRITLLTLFSGGWQTTNERADLEQSIGKCMEILNQASGD
jgi:hypothetical protein